MGWPARTIGFLILTAGGTGEVIGARPSEILTAGRTGEVIGARPSLASYFPAQK